MRSVLDSLDRVGLRRTLRGGAADLSRSDPKCLTSTEYRLVSSSLVQAGGISEEGRRDSICEGDDWPPGQTVLVIHN